VRHRRRPGPTGTGTRTDPDRPLDHYAVIWQRPLRRPLYDPKPVVEIKAKAPEPMLAIRLRGTVIEEGFSYAILTDAKGKVVLARVGRTVGGAQIKSISDGSVQVLFAGKLRTLKIQKPKSRR
jgi:type II secretory pathway component PulC